MDNEFQPNNMYSALNADSVSVNSTVIAGNSIDEIKQKFPSNSLILLDVLGEEASSRFVCSDGQAYDLVYVLNMAPREGAWSDANFPMDLVGSVIKSKANESRYVITSWEIGVEFSIQVGDGWVSYDTLYNEFEKLDGSPLGYEAPKENVSIVTEPKGETNE